MDQPDDLILIGRITKPQGNRGAVRMLPEFEPLEHFEGLKTSELLLRPTARSPLGAAEQQVHVEGYFLHGQFVILELEEAPDMNAAERLREMEVYVPRAQLWDLEPGHFLAHELEGFEVKDRDSVVGTVKGIHPGSGHDFIIVRTAANREFLIPFAKTVVKEVDTNTRTIHVEMPPGLDEL
ncbi:MAG: ribosome maturation factor RimM [Candidatus Sumerlaeaceae bacterium]